jgi:membrane protease YdiL (CAAX protease family)
VHPTFIADGAGREPILLLPSSRLAALIDVLAVAGLLLAGELMGGGAAAVLLGFAPFAEKAEAETIEALLVPVLVGRAALTYVVLKTLLVIRRQAWASMGVRVRGLGFDLLLGLGALIALLIGGLAMQIVINFFWPDWLRQFSENADRLAQWMPPFNPLQFAALAITVGWYEELLFRGFLMTRLRRLTGSWIAAVPLSTALFALLHAFDQTFGAVLLITVLSLVFSMLTIWRRSIVPAMVAHALFDLIQMLLLSAAAQG